LELIDKNEIDVPPIVGFCKALISRHVQNWPPTEEALAEDFVQWFGLQPLLTRDRLAELCLSKGVNLSFAALPYELRGFNCSFQNRTEIVITERQRVLGADLHTFLHEFRELLENAFVELGYATLGAEGSWEVQAEHFATSARLKLVEREVPAFLESAEKIEAKWARYLAYTFICVCGAIYALSCIFLPHLEEIDSEVERQRYVRT